MTEGMSNVKCYIGKSKNVNFYEQKDKIEKNFDFNVVSVFALSQFFVLQNFLDVEMK